MATHRQSTCIVLLFTTSIAAFSTPRAKLSIKPSVAYHANILLEAKLSKSYLVNERKGRGHPLYSLTGNIDTAKCDESNTKTSHLRSNIFSWKDLLPISLHVIVCLVAAFFVSTYEDYDVTHTRPNPSTIRRPTYSYSQQLNYLGAATRGMGWGIQNRILSESQETFRDADQERNEFEEWYGSGATTLQWKPSYNEIMLQHRTERVKRWASNQSDKRSSSTFNLESSIDATSSPDKEQMQQAVLNLYQALDDLESLKIMADDYRWDEMKDMLTPYTMNSRSSSIRYALEYSLDTLKSSMQARSISYEEEDLSRIIGFDWGSCAWRHCGAKADAQESLAELYSNVGMLEPFECRFVIGWCKQMLCVYFAGSLCDSTHVPLHLLLRTMYIDIIERSLRDVLSVVPDELQQHKNGIRIQVKPYTPYVSQADKAADGIGLDYEYVQVLSDLRVDLSD